MSCDLLRGCFVYFLNGSKSYVLRIKVYNRIFFERVCYIME